MKKSIKLILLIAVFAVLLVSAMIIYNRLSDEYRPDALVTNEPSYSSEQAAGGGHKNETDTQDPDNGRESAPDITVYDANGDEVSLSDYLGTPVVINFWASWCPQCKLEMPDFNDKSAEYSEKVQFMMVNLTDGRRETTTTATDYVTGQGYDFPVFFDTDGSAANAYGVSGIPATFFVDAQGKLTARASGPLDAESLDRGIAMITQ